MQKTRSSAGHVHLAIRAAALSVSLAVTGSAVSAQTYSFGSVSVTGNQRIEDSTILSYTGISRGETVTAAELNDAAQAIRETGLFSAVEVVPQGGTLVIRVVENPTVNIVAFEGNDRISDEQLAAVVQSTPRDVYSTAQAERDTAAITEAYASQGRIGAVVRPTIIRRDNNRVDLVFEIAEGGITEVERISFVGNQTFSDRRLRGVLETKQAGLLRLLVQRDTFSAERLQFDRQVLTDFYNSRGYPDFLITDVDVSLTRERDAYLITFFVQEGQQFRVGNVTASSQVAGADAQEFLAAARLRTGMVYSPSRIENDIARLETLALRKGLNFVRVDPQITRDDRGLILNVNYALVPGERIFVERIDIEGNTTTLDRVIRRQFNTVEGDPFNPREIRESAERIRALGFFASTDVNAREGSSPDQVVIDVDVTEQPTGSLSFGANYNSDNGVSLVASFSEDNFLGRGQGLSFDISVGADTRNVGVSFSEPAFLGRDLRFGLNANYRTTDNASALYDTETGRFSPSLAFPVSQNGRLSVFYAYEYTDITGVAGERTDPPKDRASIVIFEEAEQGGVSTNSLGYSYSYDTRRAGLDPNTGVILRFGQEFGVGDNQFVRTSASAAVETRVFNDDVILRGTVEGGALKYNEGSSRVTDRYFLGSRIFRGFEPNGVGPRDADTGDALGGNYYAVARVEAEFPLGLPEEYGITGGVFLDHGSVWDVGETYGADVLYNDYTPRTVAGVSIFWDTPIGPLRFNFSEPVDVQEQDETNEFDITISTSF
ncbi:outer membrane protein assembly factor BamA [Histidinibacterium aquaticum]|uniref:Outer membrane protein assembly factor BamA n=1 Tax=Histidinibacterium aquaticum TaxID=2613962 RepID=A0A5J5GML8_9RHOB|nr:outer membrane protein assembly factor BamA [Histidinibacterium aquaticum]KAA9008732.1 outer membrane protein assembly factor BamA [Histidinibacterium aquaticum]